MCFVSPYLSESWSNDHQDDRYNYLVNIVKQSTFKTIGLLRSYLINLECFIISAQLKLFNLLQLLLLLDNNQQNI